MPWQETDPVQQRQEFILAYLKRDRSFSALCRSFGVARKTGYKWLGRFMAGGLVGLADQSRARDTMVHRTPAAIEQLIVQMRRQQRTWGPKKIVRRLHEDHPSLPVPAVSTAASILKKHGVVVPASRRRRSRSGASLPLRTVDGPNTTWGADFKGQFWLGDGVLCYPATITDLYSRKLLRCRALTSTRRIPMVRVVDSAFREFGLPNALRTDNGPPFRPAMGSLRLSRFAVFLLELGVSPEFIAPGKPQQNGSHERMHRTLKAEAVTPPAKNLREQQARFDRFVREFNTERPHEALAFRTPESLYIPSTRAYPKHVELPYASHLHVRRVYDGGTIQWGHTLYSIATSLAGKRVALEYICEGLARVQFHWKVLGIIDEEERIFIPNVDWHSPESDIESCH